MKVVLLNFLLVASVGVSGQAPASLVGLVYQGTEEAEFQEGCEGCGNPGYVEFLAKGQVDCSLPGSDTPVFLSYTREEDLILLEDGKWTMELKADTLFFTAYEYRHTYVLMRE